MYPAIVVVSLNASFRTNSDRSIIFRVIINFVYMERWHAFREYIQLRNPNKYHCSMHVYGAALLLVLVAARVANSTVGESENIAMHNNIFTQSSMRYNILTLMI